MFGIFSKSKNNSLVPSAPPQTAPSAPQQTVTSVEINKECYDLYKVAINSCDIILTINSYSNENETINNNKKNCDYFKKHILTIEKFKIIEQKEIFVQTLLLNAIYQFYYKVLINIDICKRYEQNRQLTNEDKKNIQYFTDIQEKLNDCINNMYNNNNSNSNCEKPNNTNPQYKFFDTNYTSINKKYSNSNNGYNKEQTETCINYLEQLIYIYSILNTDIKDIKQHLYYVLSDRFRSDFINNGFIKSFTGNDGFVKIGNEEIKILLHGKTHINNEMFIYLSNFLNKIIEVFVVNNNYTQIKENLQNNTEDEKKVEEHIKANNVNCFSSKGGRKTKKNQQGGKRRVKSVKSLKKMTKKQLIKLAKTMKK
jgi:hypothetical protein